MPIEELLALYNCVPPTIQTFSSTGGKRKSKTSRNAGLDTTLMPPPDTPKTSTELSSSEKAKDKQSEDAATAESDTQLETKSEAKIESKPETEPESDSKLGTQTETKLNTDSTEKIDKETKEQIPSDELKSKNDEHSDTSKVLDKGEPSKSEIKEENKGVPTETNNSDKENSSDYENQSNGSDHRERAETDEQETKGKSHLK